MAKRGRRETSISTLERPTPNLAESSPPAAARGLSPASLVSFVVCLAAFIGPLRPLPDPDSWWHLATGNLILDTGRIPTSDPFSWTAGGNDWVAHEWGTEIVFALVDRWAGPAGLLVMAGLLVGAAFLLLRRTLQRIVANEWIVATVLVTALYLTKIMWTLRPHLISILFVVFFLHTLVAFRQRAVAGRIWWLVPLTLLWANLHAGFISGVVLVWIFAVVALLERRDDARRLVLLAASVTVAGAINPEGPGIYFFSVYLARVSQEVVEWHPPEFREFFGILFAVMLLGTPLLLAVRRQKCDLALLATAAVFGFLGLSAVRNVWLAAVLGAPAFAVALSSLPLIPGSSGASGRELRLLWGAHLFAGVAAVGLAVTMLAGKSDSYLRAEGAFPEAAVQRLSALPPGRLVNPYSWGGYLIWKLPEFPVSIDGRADMYGDELLEEALVVERLQPGWRDFLEDNDVRYVLAPIKRPLAEAVRLLSGWRIVYEDSEAILFERIRV
jgi:hypothetical protein